MANDVVADPKAPSKTSITIEGLFKVTLTALVGFMGWQQSSMSTTQGLLTAEVAAARTERTESDEKNREEREKLIALALGIKADAAAAKTAATTLKADVANVQKSVVEVKKSVAEIQ